MAVSCPISEGILPVKSLPSLKTQDSPIVVNVDIMKPPHVDWVSYIRKFLVIAVSCPSSEGILPVIFVENLNRQEANGRHEIFGKGGPVPKLMGNRKTGEGRKPFLEKHNLCKNAPHKA